MKDNGFAHVILLLGIPIAIIALVLAFLILNPFKKDSPDSSTDSTNTATESAHFPAFSATPKATPKPSATARVSPIPTPTPRVQASQFLFTMKVLVLKYFPVTSEGQTMDTSYTGDVGGSLNSIKTHVNSVTNNLAAALQKATQYQGYKNPSATASLKYDIVDTKEFLNPVPFDSTTRIPKYSQLLNDNGICNYVDNQGVNEVWLWAYQGPTYPGSNPPAAYLGISESKMSGPNGDISNSYRSNDMPKCSKTYRVYTFNYGRGTAEAMESWGHQMEAELSEVDNHLFRDLFQGPNYPATLGQNGRCGSVHNPPNARNEYDRNNPGSQKSDCLDWKPDGLGTLSDISCQNWGCQEGGDNNNPSLNYMIWNWQNLPGANNDKTYQGKRLRNFWEVHANFDQVMTQNKTLTQ